MKSDQPTRNLGLEAARETFEGNPSLLEETTVFNIQHPSKN